MRKRKWTIQQLQESARNVTSTRQLLYKLGLKEAGGNYKQIAKYIKIYEIDTSHFRGKAWNKGLTGVSKPRLKLSDLLCENSTFQSHKLKIRLFKEGLKDQKCELCSWAKQTTDGRIPLELHHKNGDSRDNRLQNLQILCPNCHSLQPTHRGRNIRKVGPVVEW